MATDSIGDRMKQFYEDRYKIFLTRRTPVIMRLDGKAFHTFTRGAEKPFSSRIANAMGATAAKLLDEIQGAKCAYVQSDEINILITDYDKLTTAAWFEYNVQKMCSVAASIAGVEFTEAYHKAGGYDAETGNYTQYWKPGYFDCRVFNVPREDVINYFRWRYMDWLRNSIQMLAQSLYSHKQLHQKNQAALHEMCFQRGQNWNDLDPLWKNGRFLMRDGTELTDFNLRSDSDVTNHYLDSVLYPPEKECEI